MTNDQTDKAQVEHFREAARKPGFDDEIDRFRERLGELLQQAEGTDGRITFAEWIEIEAHRVAAKIVDVPEDIRAEYIAFHIRSALNTVRLLCREGLADDDIMRPPKPPGL